MTKLLFFLCTIYCFSKLFQNCPLVSLSTATSLHVNSHDAIFFLNGGGTSYFSSRFLCTFSLPSSLSSPHVGNAIADLSPLFGSRESLGKLILTFTHSRVQLVEEKN